MYTWLNYVKSVICSTYYYFFIFQLFSFLLLPHCASMILDECHRNDILVLLDSFRSSIIITISDIVLYSNETFILYWCLVSSITSQLSLPLNNTCTTRLYIVYCIIINFSLKKKKRKNKRRDFISWTKRSHKTPIIKFIISILKYYFSTIYIARWKEKYNNFIPQQMKRRRRKKKKRFIRRKRYIVYYRTTSKKKKKKV